MNIRSILLIAVALLMIGGTVLIARSWLASQRQETPIARPAEPVKPKKVTEVLIAKRDLPAGTFINDGQLRWQPWPDESVAEGYWSRESQDVHSEKELLGAVVRRGISAGEPLTRGRIIKPGDRGFLSAVLRPGYRAMAVPIDASSGIAGLIFPGDRVDVVLTHVIFDPDEQSKVDHRASETILENVRILALDQKLDDQNGDPRVAKTATVELTPKQVEILAVSRDLGHLTLSLRSLAKNQAELDKLATMDNPLEETDPTKGRTYTWDTEASRLVPRRDAALDGEVVLVSRGKEVAEQRFGNAKAKQ